MKKNVMMRIASFLLVAVLISTCGISGTYAKYVTAKSGSDFARVAKFGVNITLNDEIFADAYKDAKTDWTADENVDTITVQAATQYENVVAPGTNGSLVGFTVTGTPEVDVEVTYTADLTLTGWYVDHDNNVGTPEIQYCPIVFTVGSEEFYIGDGTVTDIAGLESAVEAAIVAKKATYHTNENLTAVDDDLSVSWKWHFESTNDNAAGTGPACQWNALDTLLGNKAAAGTPATINLAVGMTITQVD